MGGESGAKLIHPELTEPIISCAIEVHRQLGPGLLESAYVDCLAHELMLRGIPFERQKAFRIHYKDRIVGCGFRADLLVNNSVIVEVKAVSELHEIYTAQVNTYLKLSQCRVGLLINFNVKLLTHGIRRVLLPLR